jgi:hypothetical protein
MSGLFDYHVHRGTGDQGASAHYPNTVKRWILVRSNHERHEGASLRLARAFELLQSLAKLAPPLVEPFTGL